MVCKECGALNDNSLEFCRVCAAPLHEEAATSAQYVAPPVSFEQEAAPQFPQEPAQQEPAAPEAPQAGWGFVRGPRWPQPVFDMSTVDDLGPVPQQEVPAPIPEEIPEPVSQPIYEQPAYEPPVYEQPAYEQPATGCRQAPYQVPANSVRTPYNRVAGRAFQPQSYNRMESERPEPSLDDTIFTSGTVRPLGTMAGYEDDASANGYDTGVYQRGFEHTASRSAYGGDDVQDDMPYAQPRSTFKPVSKKGYSSRRKRNKLGMNKNLLFFGAVGLLVVLILVFGIIIINNNYGSVGNFFSSVFGGSPMTKDPENRLETKDGVEYCIVRVNARQGVTVRTRVGDQEETGVVGPRGYMDVTIPKSMLVPDEAVDGTTAEVTPIIQLVSSDGEVMDLDVDPFVVDVPEMNLVLDAPAGESISVSNGRVAFSGTAEDGSVAITVEGQPLTVNADGTFSGEYTLPGLGTYTLTLEAQKIGCQILRRTFNVDYTVSEASVTFEASTLRASDGADSITVKGLTDPGTAITVTGPSEVSVGAPKVNESTGNFSFTVQLSKAGHYELDMTFSKDGAISTKTVVVERPPVLSEYKFYPPDYDRMTQETGHTASYELPGTVSEIVHEPTDAEPYLLAIMDVKGNDVLIEYRNAKYMSGIKQGDSKRPLGDYEGVDPDTGLPKVYVWFVYDK